MRKISYAQAINEAFNQAMEKDDSIFVIGIGVESPWYVGKTMDGLDKKFGRKRVIDPPVSEDGITGVAIGAAIAGMRPIMVHPRMDFMLLAMNQIINHAASWHYMFGGKVNVPVTIRSIINRGGEQASQHSKSLQSMLMHVPGLKVVMPSTPYDAKGLLIASIEDDNPVVYIDDRWLYDQIDEVPEEPYTVPIGKGIVRRFGKDVTIVATSYMVFEAMRAAENLEKEGIDTEIVDLRSLKPLDESLLLDSVKKTGRLVVADASWKTCGAAAEISAIVASDAFEYLKAPIIRVTLPDVPAPASCVLEKEFYPDSEDIASAVRKIV
jgi:pyruvate/2-oxoglutarate/acetoin dehydrogenase E1 component